MEVDEALMKLGGLGRWQFIYYTVLCIFVMFPATWHMFAIVYIGYKPKHRCRVDDVSIALPLENGETSSCMMFTNGSVINETQPCDNGWVYDLEEGTSIVAEWDLVCDRSYMTQLTQTFLVGGVMIGSMVFASLADNFGRKPVFLFSQWSLVVVGIATAFNPNLYVFFALRFMTGALQQGVVLVGFVMICELFASPYRTFAGIIAQTFWAFGISIYPLWAYLIPNWRYLQFAISSFAVCTISFIWLLSESVPWLYANNRVEEAEAVIRKAANINNIQMPQQILKRKVETEIQLCTKPNDFHVELKPKNILKRICHKNKNEDKSIKKYTLLDIIKNKTMLKNTALMSLIWTILMLGYYGLSLNTSSLAGNRYLNGFVNFIVEIPIYILSFFFISRFGRRKPLFVYSVISGSTLILTYFIPKQSSDESKLWILSTCLYILGKLTFAGSIGISYLYTQELFPTMLRSQALGVCSFFSRFGNILATFTPYLAELVPWLPGPLFGTLSICGGICVLFLPETLNRALPQTIEDVEVWSQPVNKVEITKADDNEILELKIDNKETLVSNYYSDKIRF